jgi:hypothetical protein
LRTQTGRTSSQPAVTERGADAQSLGDLLEHEQEAEHASELRGPRELDGLVELAPQQAAEGFDAGGGPVGDRVEHTGKWLRSVVQGHFNYYAVPGNLDCLRIFRNRWSRLWRTQLLHRSQRRRCQWARMSRPEARWLPAPHVLHPWPAQRFAASHSR